MISQELIDIVFQNRLAELTLSHFHLAWSARNLAELFLLQSHTLSLSPGMISQELGVFHGRLAQLATKLRSRLQKRPGKTEQ